MIASGDGISRAALGFRVEMESRSELGFEVGMESRSELGLKHYQTIGEISFGLTVIMGGTLLL